MSTDLQPCLMSNALNDSSTLSAQALQGLVQYWEPREGCYPLQFPWARTTLAAWLLDLVAWQDGAGCKLLRSHYGSSGPATTGGFLKSMHAMNVCKSTYVSFRGPSVGRAKVFCSVSARYYQYALFLQVHSARHSFFGGAMPLPSCRTRLNRGMKVSTGTCLVEILCSVSQLWVQNFLQLT